MAFRNTVNVEPRFTLDGSRALEDQLRCACDAIVTGVRRIIPESRLEAILLGGGYGRGEGGVLKSRAGDRPYNDLELYVCARGNGWLNESRYRRRLHRLGEHLSSDAGVEVEFKLISLGKIHRSPPTMFFYDLAMGHRVLWGDPECLAGCNQHRDPSAIPLCEATRLLMNRCSGLLFSAERLRRNPFTSVDGDFTGRNLAKAQLGFADAVLAARGHYHWSCRERHSRICALALDEAWWPEARRHHEQGVEFKLHPERKTFAADRFIEEHKALVSLGWEIWRWIEERRLQRRFETPRDYGLSRADKCPETGALRNMLVNWKNFGPLDPGWRNLPRYPRQRLFHGLALLLWEPGTLEDEGLLHAVQGELMTSAGTFPGLVAAYESIWKRFN
jgi:hypothetical protein